MTKTIFFAGGGSAGHVEPALAVARQWKLRHSDDRAIFLGTSQGLEASLVPAAGFELRMIPKIAAPRTANLDAIAFPVKFFRSIVVAYRALAPADAVIGFGGYVCAPVYVAAAMRRIPIVIHDANAKIGWANSLGSRFTKYLAVAHEIKRGRFAGATHTGLPLRWDVEISARESAKDWVSARTAAKVRLGWNPTHPSVVILGGSQGSRSLNDEIALAKDKLGALGIQVLHSVGPKNPIGKTTPLYKAVQYIEDMPAAYLGSDLVIARGGAVTCAEFAALGKMAVFVPLAIGNGEQARNADSLVEDGRAIVVAQRDFTAQWLLDNIDSLLFQSANNSPSGLTDDLNASSNIVDLMERAIKESHS